jgi:hypothetical protein
MKRKDIRSEMKEKGEVDVPGDEEGGGRLETS